MEEKNLAIAAIRKKLVGKKLNYKEIYAIMDQISEKKLGDVLTTYFAASGFSKGFSDEELYYLTKAMVETGDKLKFPGIVAVDGEESNHRAAGTARCDRSDEQGIQSAAPAPQAAQEETDQPSEKIPGFHGGPARRRRGTGSIRGHTMGQ